MDYLLGIDVGTSNVKAVLYNVDGSLFRQSSFDYDMEQPLPNYAEQDPDIWWEGVLSCLRGLGLTNLNVAAIGVTGQMHSLVMLDEANKVIRKSILWCDQRTEREAKDLEKLVGRDTMQKITGNPPMTGFTLAKLLWVRKNEPENYKRCRKFMVTKDYIVYKLTGVFSADVTDASGMQLLDINKRIWSKELLEKLAIPETMLCPVHESMEVVGKTLPDIERLTGLRTGTPVIAGAGDQAAAAIGNGIIEEGSASLNLGSSGVIFAYAKKPIVDPDGRVHTMCHALPNAWHIMAVTQGAGLSLKWFKDNFYQEEQKKIGDIYYLLNKQAEVIPPGAEGLLFLPYLMGERSPILDPNAKGVFYGITPKHTRGHFVRAIMEGVALSFRDCYEVFKDMGIVVESMRFSGGGSRSDLWSRIIASAIGVELVRMKESEAGTKGMAILAGISCGVCQNIPNTVEKVVSTGNIIQKENNLENVYDIQYTRFKGLYYDLKESSIIPE